MNNSLRKLALTMIKTNISLICFILILLLLNHMNLNYNLNYYNNTILNKPKISQAAVKVNEKKNKSKSKKDEKKIKLNDVDKYLLAKIAMAEAEGESTDGKALVMLVVLNRVKSKDFPNDVNDVIFQNNQFSPIKNGRYDKVEPNTDCWKALEKVKNGWNKSEGALYFTSEKGNNTWHHRNLEYLFTYEGHRFYK